MAPGPTPPRDAPGVRGANGAPTSRQTERGQIQGPGTPLFFEGADTSKRILRRFEIIRGPWWNLGGNEGARREIRPQTGRCDRRAPHSAEHRGGRESGWHRSQYAPPLAEGSGVPDCLPGSASSRLWASRRTTSAGNFGGRDHTDKAAARSEHASVGSRTGGRLNF